MWDEWAKNITGAAGADSGNIYQNYANLGVVNAAPQQSAGRKAVIQADIDDRKRREDAAIGEAKKGLDDQYEKDKTDPGKAKMVMRPDRSGYDFYNGAGERLNINDFSLLVGKRPDELLADSDNPRDQKFVSDYNTMRTLSNAWVNGDTETLAKYRQADPAKFNELVTKYKNPSDMVRGFMDYYTDYYSTSNNKQTADTPRFSPGDPRGGESVYGQDRSVSLTDPYNSKVMLGAPNLQQTLTPVTTMKPEKPGGIGGWFEDKNPWSDYNRKLKEFEEAQKANPWSAYYSSLMGR